MTKNVKQKEDIKDVFPKQTSLNEEEISSFVLDEEIDEKKKEDIRDFLEADQLLSENDGEDDEVVVLTTYSRTEKSVLFQKELQPRIFPHRTAFKRKESSNSSEINRLIQNRFIVVAFYKDNDSEELDCFLDAFYDLFGEEKVVVVDSKHLNTTKLFYEIQEKSSHCSGKFYLYLGDNFIESMNDEEESVTIDEEFQNRLLNQLGLLEREIYPLSLIIKKCD